MQGPVPPFLTPTPTAHQDTAFSRRWTAGSPALSYLHSGWPWASHLLSLNFARLLSLRVRRLGQMICKVLSRSNFWIKPRASSWRKQPKRPGGKCGCEALSSDLSSLCPCSGSPGEAPRARPTLLPLAGRRVQARGRSPHSQGQASCSLSTSCSGWPGALPPAWTAAQLPAPPNLLPSRRLIPSTAAFLHRSTHSELPLAGP